MAMKGTTICAVQRFGSIAIAGDGEIIIYYMVRDVAAGTARPGGENNVYV